MWNGPSRSKSATNAIKPDNRKNYNSRYSARPSKIEIENKMVRRREKEYMHEKTWGGQVEYYDRHERANAKYEEWTSPRYYDENNKLMENLRKEKEKGELLEKRRERLRRLLGEEEKSYEVECMVKNREKFLGTPRRKYDDIPTEILRDLRLNKRLEEEDRRRHEAEHQLYRQWRGSNVRVKEYERDLRCKDLKLSWLDQQIERRIKKEEEEEECRRMLEERERRLKKEEERERAHREELEEKEVIYREELRKQAKRVEEKSEEIKRVREMVNEDEELKKEIYDYQERLQLEEKKRKELECALFNVRAHKQKLKRKTKIIQEEIEKQTQLVEELLKAESLQSIQNEIKKMELKATLEKFLELQKQQQQIEKQRENYLDFIFDSEAKLLHDQQTEIWETEREARDSLLRDVIASLANQIAEKIERRKSEEERLVGEHADGLRRLEEWEVEVARVRRERERLGEEWKKGVELQLKEKKAVERRLRSLRQFGLEEELEKARKEEERLKVELMELQRKRRPCVPVRSGIFLG